MAKKNFPSILSVMSLFLILNACEKDKPKEQNSNPILTTKKGDIYNIDTLNSKIEWKGYKIFNGESTSHFGKLKFKSGEITVHNGTLESGNFIADMNSLENEDLINDADMKIKLESHLKTEDFLEVEKYPTASFEISKVSAATDSGDYNTILDGNLTIKNTTQPIQFFANISQQDGVYTIASQPKEINRELFGINFKMPIKNGIIKDNFTIQVYIKAQKK